MKLTVEERIAHNIKLFGNPDYQGLDRFAARYLFSTLSHLEQIAVFAAERGDCIQDQLEDELVHRATFERLADMHGGLVPASEPVQDLIDYLEKLEGETSIAALNVMAESWLDTVFDCLAESGFASEMLTLIEEEEHRHAHEAMDGIEPNAEVYTDIVKDLEELLFRASASPEFILPIVHLIGQDNTSKMGLMICEAHKKACAVLGVEPDVYPLEVSARSLRFLNRTAPEPIDMNDWERVKAATWDTPAHQYCYIDIEIDETNPVKLQSRFIYEIGFILSKYPRLRNVIRNEQLYRSQSIVVGMRALYDDELVMTLWVPNPQKLRSWKEVVKRLARQNRKVKNETYEPFQGAVTLGKAVAPLYPPHRAQCVVTYNGDFGGDYGSGPLSDIEGMPTVVTIGRPQMKAVVKNGGLAVANVVTVCICSDHRTMDGKDIGMFASELKARIER